MKDKKKEEKQNGSQGSVNKKGLVINGKRITLVPREKAPSKKELQNSSQNESTDGKKPLSRGKQVFWRVAAVFIGVCFLIGVAGLGLVLTLMMQAPEVDLSKFEYAGATEIYDINDNYYQELETSEKREVVSIEEIPELVQLAFVSIEDQRFYSHFGVDFRGTFKAVYGVLTSGGTEGSGGSTITQQLIKQTHLSSVTSIKRKVMEWKLAYELEQQMPKREILEAYLNKINLSQAWGVESAANTYFGLSVDELSVAQSAVLASIMKAPTYYGPYIYSVDDDGNTYLEKTTDKDGNIVPVHKPENKERAIDIVYKMLELGHISERECEIAVNELENDLVGLKLPNYGYNYTYFTDAVYNEVLEDLMDKYNYTAGDAADLLANGGLKIYSTVDPIIQRALDETAEDDSIFPSQTYSAYNASVAMSEKTGDDINYIPQVGGAVVQNSTGYVVGVVGGRGSKEGNLVMNRALQKFQTGSSTKPVTTYAPGIDSKKVTLADTFDDSLISWGSWTPHNAGGGTSGIMSVRAGLTGSVNIIAVQVQKTVGYDICAEYGRKFGLDILEEDYNSAALALGGYTQGQTPLAMASAFSTFANYGVRVTPTFYRYVTDENGMVILESPQEEVQVISEQTAWLITSVLRNVVRGGTTSIYISGQDLAGKTGTTDSNMCAWFCGYTAEYAGAFWYGYDQQRVTVDGYTYDLNVGVYGGSWNGPAAFFEQAFNKFYSEKGLPSANLPSQPGGLAYRGDWVLEDTYPTGVKIPTVTVELCAESGLLPNATCPIEEKEYQDRSQVKLVENGKYVNVDYSAKDESGNTTVAPEEYCTIDHTKQIPPEGGETGTGEPSEGGSEEGGNVTPTPTPEPTPTPTPTPPPTPTPTPDDPEEGEEPQA